MTDFIDEKKLKPREMLEDMFEEQKKLDEDIMKEFGLEQIPLNKIRVAFYTELGEVYQACKKYWCWWKKTCKEVDRKDLLDELADALHFALSYQIHEIEISNPNGRRFKDWNEMRKQLVLDARFQFQFRHKVDNLEDVAFEYSSNYVMRVVELTECLGFSFEQLYLAYLKKNQVNHKRVKNGY